MFSKEDFEVESAAELFSFLPVLPFVLLVMPFVAAAYKLGFIADITGWLDT